MAGNTPRLVGRVIAGRFRVLERIGFGGMGTVYRAVQLDLDRPVALKVLALEFADNPRFIERFRLEALAMGRLTHPNIVSVTGFVSEPGEPLAIAMELLQGRTLLDRLREGGSFPITDALTLGVQIASALEAAHASGVVHRDLKPDNVFLVPLATGEEIVKLLDFGIARLNDARGTRRLTQSGTILGTPRYASPEQVRAESDVDERSDIYSLGVLLYCMLGGRPPFTSDGGRLLFQIETERPPDLRPLAPHVPEELIRVVERAIQKERGARFQTATEMRDALTAATASVQAAAMATTVQTEAPLDGSAFLELAYPTEQDPIAMESATPDAEPAPAVAAPRTPSPTPGDSSPARRRYVPPAIVVAAPDLSSEGRSSPRRRTPMSDPPPEARSRTPREPESAPSEPGPAPRARPTGTLPQRATHALVGLLGVAAVAGVAVGVDRANDADPVEVTAERVGVSCATYLEMACDCFDAPDDECDHARALIGESYPGEQEATPILHECVRRGDLLRPICE